MKINIKNIRIFYFIFFINVTLFAQDNWRIAPMGIKLSAMEGDTLVRNFKIFNEADEIIQFTINLKDYRIDEAGGELEMDPGSHKRGCASWITISPQRVTVQPHSSENVRCTFLIPDSVKQGSHWGSIFVVPDKKPSLASRFKRGDRSYEIFMQIRAKVAIHCVVEGDLKKECEITHVDAVVDSLQENLTIRSKIQNTGNVILKCKGNIEIRDEMGETHLTLPIKRFTCLAEDERTIFTKTPIHLIAGEYSAVVVIDFEGDYLVAGETFFEISNENQ